MILVSREEKNRLESVGLLKFRRIGRNPQDQNFQVANREHVSRDKSYYVTEEKEIMLFLQKYDNLNLQRINQTQFDRLKKSGLITDENIQKAGTYVPNAICFIADDGSIRIMKISRLMLELGLWVSSKNKRTQN